MKLRAAVPSWLTGRRLRHRGLGSTDTPRSPGELERRPSLEPFEVLSDIEDSEWYRILSSVATTPHYRGIVVPGLPPEDFQLNTVGLINDAALLEGLRFYREIKAVAASRNRPVVTGTRLLDFGCGWGRMIRFFFRDVSAASLYGLDVDPQMTELCARLLLYGNYMPCRPEPPISLPDAFFDIIFAYSVFSHLSPRVASLWIDELLRLLKPGGLLLITTRGSHFITYCNTIAVESDTPPYQRWLARAFADDDPLSRHGDGEFVFRPYPDALARLGPDYGEAVVPAAYVRNHWTARATLVDFVDDPQRLQQVLIVLQATR